MAVKHAKVSAVADGADTSLVRPSDWNANHTVEAGSIGDAEIASHTTTKITVPEARVTFDNAAGHDHDATDSKQVDHGSLGGLTDDDHTQYQKESEKGAANGYCELDADTLVPLTRIPSTLTGKDADTLDTKHYTDISTEIDSDISTHAAVTATHGATGAVVGTTNTQTLSAKTFSTETAFQAGIDLTTAGKNIEVDGANPKRTIILTARGARGTATTGAGDANKLPETRELATNDINIDFIAFDTTTRETCFWNIVMPDNWDASTITAKLIWTAASGTGTIDFDIQARAFADDDALDQAQGTAQNVTDTLIAADDVHITAASAAITVGGAPAGGQYVVIELSRDTASDSLSTDAQVLALIIEYGISAYSD